MGVSLGRREVNGLAAGIVAAFALLAAAGTAAVTSAGADAAGALALARSAAHLLGIVGSVILAYYAAQARRRFAGGVFATSAAYTFAGATMFAVAFLVMELGHGFGIDVFAFVADMQLSMAITMFLFTATVFGFGWAYYRIASTLGGVRP